LLPVNFHQTFIPERRYIASLLQYATSGDEGTLQKIAEDTGIPMGESSGKLPATIDYATGMGLICIESAADRSVKKPMLTAFGHVVYAEDKFLGEQMAQWLAHMNLCSSLIGATAWHEVFAKGRRLLGISFTRDHLEDYLVRIHGPTKTRTRTGPLLLTYQEDEALGRSGVLTVDEDTVTRHKAPIMDEYAIPYSAYMLQLLETYFPGQNQITLTDFAHSTLWFDICLWNEMDVEDVLRVIETKGLISVDRQMQPWIIEKRADADRVWPLIYSEIV